jgi:hypothetical protein
MPRNIDTFDAGVALIMGKLYESFPNEIQLHSNELAHLSFTEEEWGLAKESTEALHAKVNALHEVYTIYYNTAYFLLAEGYIRGERHRDSTVVSNCVLTSKGLAALQRVPKSLRAKKVSVGDLLVEFGKDATKSVAKESVTAAVKALLGGG